MRIDRAARPAIAAQGAAVSCAPLLLGLSSALIRCRRRIRPLSRATWPLLPMRDLAMAGGTGEARRFCGWKHAVRPRAFRLAVALLCAVRKAERAARPRSFRLDASCRRPFRRRTRLCAVRRLKLKVQILKKETELGAALIKQHRNVLGKRRSFGYAVSPFCRSASKDAGSIPTRS